MSIRRPTRFAERPAARQRGWMFMAVVGSLGVLAVLGLAFIGFNAPNAIPGRSYYYLQAQFDNADNLTAHYQVRMNGRLVGQVLNPHIEHGKAVVRLQLDPEVKPLRSDTRVEVRPRSAVGVRYVDLKPGQTGTPLGEDALIPAGQTATTRPLDEVLSTFDPETRVHARQFLRELGVGTATRGEGLNGAIADSHRFLAPATSLLRTVAARKSGVRSLVVGGATIADAADPVRQTIADGFESEAGALRPFFKARDALHDTLDAAPPTLSSVTTGLPHVDPFLDELTGLAIAIRPGLAAAPATFRETQALFSEARPGLRDAASTLRTAGRAVDPTLALLLAVDPTLPNLENTLQHVTPILTSLGSYGCDFVRFGRQWGSMMAYGNQAGAELRFNLVSPGLDALAGFQSKVLPAELATPADAYPRPCTVGPGRGGQ